TRHRRLLPCTARSSCVFIRVTPILKKSTQLDSHLTPPPLSPFHCHHLSVTPLPVKKTLSQGEPRRGEAVGTRGFWQQMPARLTFSLSLPPSILPSIPSSHPLEAGSVARVFASAFSPAAADVSFRALARHTKAT